MDTQLANELVAMRQEQLARSRGHGHGYGHEEAEAVVVRSRRARARVSVLRLAMWAFGPGVVAPRHVAARPECAQ
jgi:hypothetical protein